MPAGPLNELPQLASELVKLNPDVIVAGSPPAAIAAHNATHTIPIIMNSSPDPVALRLASSIARPGGNITGFWWGDEGLVGKRLELLKRGIERVGFMFNPNEPTDSDAAKTATDVSKGLGLTVRALEVSATTQLQEAFAAALRESLQGIVIGTGPLFVSARTELAMLAFGARLPAIGSFRDFALAGALSLMVPTCRISIDERRAS